MKAFVVFALLALIPLAYATVEFAIPRDSDPVVNLDMISYINNNTFGWKAGVNKGISSLTWAQAKRLCGTKINHDKTKRYPEAKLVPQAVPAAFDWRQQDGACVHPIRNQQQCGSCWAFGATEALSDRFCIQSKGATNVILAPEDLVSCDSSDYGCNGGYLENAWEYMANTGVVTESCFPYAAGSGVAPACRTTCKDGSAWTKYKADASTINTFTSVATIMQEIYTNGPVEAAFTVYQDFFNYQSGVYVHKTGGVAGGHAIKILGWGHDSASGKDYWIVANSWGTSWGIQGFFWIAKGIDECGIEDDVVAGLAVLPSAKNIVH